MWERANQVLGDEVRANQMSCVGVVYCVLNILPGGSVLGPRCGGTGIRFNT
jgi:hypothetical protein